MWTKVVMVLKSPLFRRIVVAVLTVVAESVGKAKRRNR